MYRLPLEGKLSPKTTDEVAGKVAVCLREHDMLPYGFNHCFGSIAIIFARDDVGIVPYENRHLFAVRNA